MRLARGRAPIFGPFTLEIFLGAGGESQVQSAFAVVEVSMSMEGGGGGLRARIMAQRLVMEGGTWAEVMSREGSVG